MKVLFLSSHITIPGDKTFSKNITGFGHMVRDIADYISRSGVEVDILTTSAITIGKSYNEVKLLKRTWSDLLLHIKPIYFMNIIQLIKTYRPSLKRIIKILYYSLSAGHVEWILKNGNYDLVHIHGVSYGSKSYIDCCELFGIKYIVTLHGLNSFSDSVSMENGEKKFEKDFLKFAYNNHISITVISTGILKVIKHYLGETKNIDHFYVVTNGTDISEKPNTSSLNIRQKYCIDANKKIMLCVGNLTYNKNQLQIVRAYTLLPKEIRRQLSILFLGKDAINGEVERKIRELGIEKDLIVCGNISKDEIGAFYNQADFTILASISEGFGLSIIEGFVYGLPNLTFTDLNAITDVYNEQVMFTLEQRSDEKLADGIEQLLSKKWDRDYIKQYAEKFSLERMAQEYLKFYKIVADR